MDKIKIIRKYSSSRALYDMENSKTIRQKDLPAIIDETDITIYDDEGKDITLTILFTMLASDNYKRDGVLSEKLLLEIIRNSQTELSSFINMYLEKNLDFFVENKELFMNIFKNKGGGELFNLLNQLKNAQQEVLEKYYNNN